MDRNTASATNQPASRETIKAGYVIITSVSVTEPSFRSNGCVEIRSSVLQKEAELVILGNSSEVTGVNMNDAKTAENAS